MKRLLTLWLPWLVGALALATSVLLAQHEQRVLQQTLRTSFDLGLRQAASRVEQRIASYEMVLRGVQGLFGAQPAVDAAGFAAYADALLAGADFAGLQVIGHVAARPGVVGDLYAPVTLAAPATGQRLGTIGTDMQAEPERRAALLQARDSGRIAITRRLRQAIDPAARSGDGFLMFLPLYESGQPLASVEQRRQHHRGWAFAGFRMADLMSSLYGESMPGLALRIHDGVTLGPQTLMYDSAPEPRTAGSARFEAQEYIGFAGHTWTLSVRTLPDFESLHNVDGPRIIAVSGVGLSLLLALLTHLLVSGRERAHALAQRMTREARESEERYRRIVETADEGIWLSDAAQRSVFVNPKARQMLGYDETGLMARSLADLADDADRPWVAGALASHAPAPGGRRELRLRRRDGALCWVSLGIAPIIDASGRPAGALAMFTDITAAREAGALRTQLESQLRESQKMEAIGTLAGGIAHDFNNILAAILGNAALAREPLPPGHPAAAHLAQIVQAGEHARGLVQQIVAFSRRQPLARRSQPLAPLVQATVGLLRATLPASVALQTRLGSAAPAGWVDANQLQQVLMNLCTNAWHALQGRAGTITVGLDTVQIDARGALALGLARPGAYAQLWVADDGAGMDEATRARIFEPFFTTKPVGQGTGLGLSVVHGIVTAHDGAIRVHSQPGQGSRFDLYLPQWPTQAPAGAEPAPAADPPASPPAAPARAPAPGHGERVLYVDDDPVMVTLVDALLRRAGYTVQCFEDARAAIDELQARPEAVDLVVTDYNMPGLSGLDVVRAVRALRPRLPVVISSGYLSEDIRAAAQREGVTELLQKEYSTEQLVPLVQRVLAGRSPAPGDQNRK